MVLTRVANHTLPTYPLRCLPVHAWYRRGIGLQEPSVFV